MTTEETRNEIEYKISIQLLDILLVRGVIDCKQYAQIDELNRESFSPILKELLHSY